MTAQLKEDMKNDRMRATATFNQQQVNRKELSFLGTKTEDLDTIRQQIREQREGDADKAQQIADLHTQVAQLMGAGSSEQELQNEVSSLRAGVGSLRSEVSALADSQELAIINLRSLHSAWLGVPPFSNTDHCRGPSSNPSAR